MTSSKRFFHRKAAVLSVLMIAYFVSSLFNSDFWGNILSPLNAFAAGGILYFAYLKSDRALKVSITLLLFALAFILWGTADVIWAIMSFGGENPEYSAVLWVIYVLTNCLLLSSLIIFAIEQFKKWDIVQFAIDLAVNGFLSVLMFWILFLRKDVLILNELITSDFTSILSILSDILICICIFSWFLSVRSGKIPAFLRITSFGLVLFAFADLVYYYFEYNNLYDPNSMIDFVYMLSFYIIAVGALWKTYKSSSVLDLSVVTNTGGRTRWVFLPLFPLFAVLFSVTGIINVQLSVGDLIAFTVPIFFYWGACKYVQISIEKELLLRQQNEILGQRIAEQVSELKFLANQDTLTTLFNRRYFMACLDDTSQTLRPSDLLAMLLIDLDRFKAINDTYGHDAGDKVLIELAQRMTVWNNYGATIARLGGDEFAIIFVGKYTQKEIEEFCLEIIDLCNKPIHISGNSLNLTMSVGIALVSEEVGDGKTLMKNADIAMYSAKSQGYNKYQFYNPLIDKDFKETREIEALLRQADVDKDFELFYQPQYTLSDKKLVGAEALIRWNNREHGYIPPNLFIPIAEEIESIFKIGKWVMQETMHQAKIWNEQYDGRLKVGFNISPKQFVEKGFIDMLKTLLRASGVNPVWLDAEITENVMIKDGKEVDDVFKFLKEQGISVSIDDFGSGYSALSYLNKYFFDRIKLDKSLIDNVSIYNSSGVNIVRAAINMAHAAGIQTIAEGVETQEQLDILKKLGCDQVQGYLLGRPVPVDIFEQQYISK